MPTPVGELPPAQVPSNGPYGPSYTPPVIPPYGAGGPVVTVPPLPTYNPPFPLTPATTVAPSVGFPAVTPRR
ncbi:MAG: hypothetical protein QOI56_1333 [Actinomycetota bacterium]|nr:hypothetical protein [Actinomycetota bacterium]